MSSLAKAIESDALELPADFFSCLQRVTDMATAVYTKAPALAGNRLADYLALPSPRLSGMALLTVAAGAILASGDTTDWRIVTHIVAGAALVAAGANALNQLMEREIEARMQRTQDRPLPSGRLQPGEVLVFGVASALGGVGYLAFTLPNPLAAVVAALTLLIYVCIYTSLKRRTPLNTLVGAIPGALPPVIGWTAVRGSLNAEAVALFAVLFLWQVPHFLAIAWIYRADYCRAGQRMLPCVDLEGSMTGRQMTCYCLALLAASFTPFLIGRAGPIYLASALLLGIGFLLCAVGFARLSSLARARTVLQASLVYLPALLIFQLLDRIPR
jgi:protoheme IX farnesyltransferase